MQTGRDSLRSDLVIKESQNRMRPGNYIDQRDHVVTVTTADTHRFDSRIVRCSRTDVDCCAVNEDQVIAAVTFDGQRGGDLGTSV